MYRPQFPMLAPPPGFVWQPCIFQFDKTNTQAFVSVSLGTGQESEHIPLPLDHDAAFILLGIKVGNALLNFKLWDPYGNPLMEDYTAPNIYASELPPFTVLEGPGIRCPAGSVLAVRLQGR